ncbi:SDR family oxidoreductase [Lysinibacillus odysseyi]|uniref:SDR family oxidoreductase n=1 Tax=Lysinibacillus odysseyi TaxID=202611 RepID=UPI0006905477|nr:SDR family oxidoreductase [Lysinibacillus odysseyi]
MDEWNWDLNISLNGCVLGMKYIIYEMQKAGGGSVINISSIGCIFGLASSSPYITEKGALRTSSKSAVVEYEKDKIRVNSVHPGFIVMTAHTMEAGMPLYQARTHCIRGITLYDNDRRSISH